MARSHLVARTIAAMGTTVTVRVVSSHLDERTTRDAVDRALDWFGHVEACCSRFAADSELQRLCAAPGVPTRVSPMLYQAIHFAIDVAERTGGAFDPCIGGQMHGAGYDRHHASGARAPLVSGDGTWRDVRRDPGERTITLARPLQLDLGAVAKGMAIDLAARELRPLGSAAIDAGGDVFAAGRNAEGAPWRVGVRNPFDPAALVGTITVDGMAVCTTATYERGPHLLDARTGAAAAGLASVSVMAPTAMAADAASTAAFVLGATDGAAFLASEGLPALVVHGDGTVVPVGAWPR